MATIIGLLSIVPLATWAATGRLKDAWVAMRGYMLCLGLMAAVAVFLGILELLALLAQGT